ncbi:unnamed protein product [Vitrella brassicaformis CCMP3155]|uniref:Serine aminopeptidase S33 domain-containing protein n=3 Tax=Vitrella brassicaformis TaxID=1169539 RepID=A0A0G4F486_VITBC|nr:unnamed protein product [Vitrella brassicaformis CCMP3155]|eukprot:CEM07063.1 unnamed protein product [Vitrella brassicaformis CCMP3155]
MNLRHLASWTEQFFHQRWETFVDRLVFPGRTTYKIQDFEELMWIPGTLDFGTATPETCIPCLYFPKHDARFVILYFHGNGEDLGRCRLFCRDLSEGFDTHVIAMEYPGYGIAPGKPNEEMVLRYAEACIRFLIERCGWDPCKIIVMGRSIGTGPALHLAARYDVFGAILVAPFVSIREVVKERMGGFAMGLISDRFNNLENIRHTACRVLFVHGQDDGMYSPKHSQMLEKHTPGKTILSTPEGMTHNVDLFSNVLYFASHACTLFPVPDYQFIPLYIPEDCFDPKWSPSWHPNLRWTPNHRRIPPPPRNIDDIPSPRDLNALSGSQRYVGVMEGEGEGEEWTGAIAPDDHRGHGYAGGLGGDCGEEKRAEGCSGAVVVRGGGVGGNGLPPPFDDMREPGEVFRQFSLGSDSSSSDGGGPPNSILYEFVMEQRIPPTPSQPPSLRPTPRKPPPPPAGEWPIHLDSIPSEEDTIVQPIPPTPACHPSQPNIRPPSPPLSSPRDHLMVSPRSSFLPFSGSLSSGNDYVVSSSALPVVKEDLGRERDEGSDSVGPIPAIADLLAEDAMEGRGRAYPLVQLASELEVNMPPPPSEPSRRRYPPKPIRRGELVSLSSPRPLPVSVPPDSDYYPTMPPADQAQTDRAIDYVMKHAHLPTEAAAKRPKQFVGRVGSPATTANTPENDRRVPSLHLPQRQGEMDGRRGGERSKPRYGGFFDPGWDPYAVAEDEYQARLDCLIEDVVGNLQDRFGSRCDNILSGLSAKSSPRINPNQAANNHPSRETTDSTRESLSLSNQPSHEGANTIGGIRAGDGLRRPNVTQASHNHGDIFRPASVSSGRSDKSGSGSSGASRDIMCALRSEQDTSKWSEDVAGSAIEESQRPVPHSLLVDTWGLHSTPMPPAAIDWGKSSSCPSQEPAASIPPMTVPPLGYPFNDMCVVPNDEREHHMMPRNEGQLCRVIDPPPHPLPAAVHSRCVSSSSSCCSALGSHGLSDAIGAFLDNESIAGG